MAGYQNHCLPECSGGGDNYCYFSQQKYPSRHPNSKLSSSFPFCYIHSRQTLFLFYLAPGVTKSTTSVEGPQRSVISWCIQSICVESLFTLETVLGAGETVTRIVKIPIPRETKTMKKKTVNEFRGKWFQIVVGSTGKIQGAPMKGLGSLTGLARKGGF